MANRLANLSKPELFDSFDTDLCVCVHVRVHPKGPACVTLQEGHCHGGPSSLNKDRITMQGA